METSREKARADKKLVVASVLKLTESEAKAFWPVYNAYQSDMAAHYDRLERGRGRGRMRTRPQMKWPGSLP
jgi:hypothetical protein